MVRLTVIRITENIVDYYFVKCWKLLGLGTVKSVRFRVRSVLYPAISIESCHGNRPNVDFLSVP